MTGTTHAQALRELVSTDSEVLENEPLAKRTTLGVGAADVLVTPANETDLAATMRYAATHEVPVFLSGGVRTCDSRGRYSRDCNLFAT